ncbi:MAG: hypothetical protein HY296_04460 [Thaumarchaeota archaeon]|nr:hypothetical protein [Nitrososphaerota archaeon]
MTDEHSLGTTVLTRGRKTIIPKRVIEVLELRPTPGHREKILWVQEGDEIVVRRGTTQSSSKKTMLRVGGRTAVPMHVREILNLESTLRKEETMVWIQKGGRVIVRKGTPRSSLTE